VQPVVGAVIAAAGLGSRLGHGLPKCMVEVEGTPILSRLVDAVSVHVDRIHVVVGYREELVADYCAIHHRDVVLVRNPDFRTTTTGHSYLLGARGLGERALFMDGDILVRPEQLAGILSASTEHETVVGITRATTDDGVTVELTGPAENPSVVGFTRRGGDPYEWANVMVAPPSAIGDGEGYVFEALATQLPLAAAYIEMAEVDTDADLDRATAFVRDWR
jgi:CTP:molybdopterin cytidylyltransferase MocA